MSTIKVDTISTRSGSGNVTVASGNALRVESGDLVVASGNTSLTGNLNTSGTSTLSGNTTVGGTLTNTGLITASAGVAIGGTGADNTLDDYEEGTFTPTFNQGFASPTYSQQVGRYTKIGRTVQFHLHIDINTVGAAAGVQWKLGELPFTSANVGYVWGGAFSVYTGGVHDDSFSNKVYWAIGPGQTTVLAYKASGGLMLGTNVSAPTGGFYIAGQYLVSA